MTDVSSIRQRIDGLKERAGFFRQKRRKDVELYAVLAEALNICEEVGRDGLLDDLKASALSEIDTGARNRTYFLARADVYVVVCRMVLEGKDNRNSFYRYAATLREASARQITSATLVQWLCDNGGINALFKARPVQARSSQTKTLHLNEAVEIPRDRPFTLHLRRDSRGFFDLVDAA